MNIVLLALIGVILVIMLARLARESKKRDAQPDGNDGMHNRRVGDGLRRLRENKKKYGTMTEALLAETPDEGLLEAVLANLWAKMRPDMTDALTVIQQQNRQRQHIFALYAVTGGVKQAGFEKIKESPDAVLLPMTLEGLEALGMPQSAELFSRAMQEEEADAYDEPYIETFEGEGGRERMTAYIRDNAAAFCDQT